MRHRSDGVWLEEPGDRCLCLASMTDAAAIVVGPLRHLGGDQVPVGECSSADTGVGHHCRRDRDDPGVAAVPVDDHHPLEPVMGDAGRQIPEQAQERFRPHGERARKAEPVGRQPPMNFGQHQRPRIAGFVEESCRANGYGGRCVGVRVERQVRAVLLDRADRQQQDRSVRCRLGDIFTPQLVPSNLAHASCSRASTCSSPNTNPSRILRTMTSA